MTEPTEPTESGEPIDAAAPEQPADLAKATDAIEFTDPPEVTESAEVVPDDTEPVTEPVVLPDESNARTTELAARLRQSALAQVEAARAALATEAEAPKADEAAGEDAARASKPASLPIPALDDPTLEDTVTRSVAAADPATSPKRLSEPLAVAAAAVAEAQASGGQNYLSGAADPASSSTGSRIRVATIAAAVLAIAAVVVLVVFAQSSAHDHAVDKARAAALAAAKPEVAAALTYNYRTLESDFAHAEQGMSTKFKANYARTAASSVTPLATSTHAISTGTVAEAGIISATTSTVRVLVFADQTAQNSQLGDKSRLDRSVIEVTMVKQGGRWVIDDLKPF